MLVPSVLACPLAVSFRTPGHCPCQVCKLACRRSRRGRKANERRVRGQSSPHLSRCQYSRPLASPRISHSPVFYYQRGCQLIQPVNRSYWLSIHSTCFAQRPRWCRVCAIAQFRPWSEGDTPCCQSQTPCRDPFFQRLLFNQTYECWFRFHHSVSARRDRLPKNAREQESMAQKMGPSLCFQPFKGFT